MQSTIIQFRGRNDMKSKTAQRIFTIAHSRSAPTMPSLKYYLVHHIIIPLNLSRVDHWVYHVRLYYYIFLLFRLNDGAIFAFFVSTSKKKNMTKFCAGGVLTYTILYSCNGLATVFLFHFFTDTLDNGLFRSVVAQSSRIIL